MNPEIRELYQQIILDHNKNPKNFGKIDPYNHHAEGFNPLCGDHLHLYLHTEGDRIVNISFEGGGCAISKSSASMMTAFVKGKTVQEAETLFNRFHEMVTGTGKSDEDYSDLDKLAVLQGVREFPVRVKCASLSWHTLVAALKQPETVISTE